MSKLAPVLLAWLAAAGAVSAGVTPKNYSEEVDHTAAIIGELLWCSIRIDATYKESATALYDAMQGWHRRNRVRMADPELFEDKVQLRANVLGAGLSPKLDRQSCSNALAVSRSQRGDWRK